MSQTTDTDDSTDTTTRAEHHADNSAATVREAKRMLAAVLRARTAREWAISSRGLADATGYRDQEQDVGINPSTVRDCIKELRQERDLPIVSCSQGYYLVTDAADLQRELDKIADEIETRKETRRELTAAFNRYGGGADE